MNPDQWEALKNGGLGMALVIALLAFYREYIVPGTRYRRDLEEMTKDRDEWKDRALSAHAVNEKIADSLAVLAADHRNRQA